MRKKSLLSSKVKCWGFLGIVLVVVVVGVLMFMSNVVDASPKNFKETNVTTVAISPSKASQPQVEAYSLDEIQYFAERQISLKALETSNLTLSKEDFLTTIEMALRACKPFAGEEILNVTRFERARLVTHCAVAKADDTFEISITCRDKATVEWFKQRFDTLIAPDYEPLVLRGRVHCFAFLPFLQNPPKGVVSYAFYSKAKLRNVVATSPRFMGTSSSSVQGAQGLGYYGLDGSGEIVAVIDTGISSGDYGNNFHCDLMGGL
ncbi:MAG: hypothetical protein Q4F99_04220, partial [bacterium]|nr:hypothetical protein [bacterium]